MDGNQFFLDGINISESSVSDCYRPLSNSARTLKLLDSSGAKYAATNGEMALGNWSSADVDSRIAAVRRFSHSLTERKSAVVKAIVWDTDRCMKVATAEVDAALAFVDFVAEQYLARATRHTQNPLPSQRPGVVLCWGAECTAEFGELLHIAIPALLTGCVVVVKVPCCGGLSHIVTSTMFQNAFPDSVLQYVVGAPEELGNSLLQTEKFDMLAMTGERSVADKLIHAHPKPHRLKMHLDLAGDILAVITPEASDRIMACREIAGLVVHGASKGPVKLVMAHRSIIQDVLRELAGALQELRLGADVACRRCRTSPERAQG
jgi:glyceraldehyde-3-phosphate dehydrogenase (NADP+)